MKISQAVLFLACNSSAEKVVVDRTVEIFPLSKDGIRSGKRTISMYCSVHFRWISDMAVKEYAAYCMHKRQKSYFLETQTSLWL